MTAPQTARNVLAAVAVLAALYVVWLMRDVVLLAVLALFVAVALSAPVGAIQRRLRLPRAPAIALVYVLLLGALVLVGAIVVPPLVDQVEDLTREVPHYVQRIDDSDTFRRWDDEYHIVDELQQQAGKLPSLLSDAASELETVTVGVFERAAETIAVLAVAFLLLLDAPRTMGWIYRRFPPDREAQARRLAAQAAQAIGGYCAGVFSVAALAGLVSFVAMEILGIPFSVPLAVQMSFFALLPLVGSAIGAIVIAIVAAFEGVGTVLGWLAFFLVYQQLETHVLGPFVYRRTVAMRPVLVILSVLAGASLLGILGALLAIPAAATIQIAVQEWWRVRHPAEAEPDGAVPEAH
ncbi:MAG TPA: AI-2E family transporter [Capillimicrobium sp.]|nr:AI-2E family transporter [Capillimicrobium sp.]